MIEYLPKSGIGWKGLGLSQLIQGKDARHALQMATKYLYVSTIDRVVINARKIWRAMLDLKDLGASRLTDCAAVS